MEDQVVSRPADFVVFVVQFVHFVLVIIDLLLRFVLVFVDMFDDAFFEGANIGYFQRL